MKPFLVPSLHQHLAAENQLRVDTSAFQFVEVKIHDAHHDRFICHLYGEGTDRWISREALESTTWLVGWPSHYPHIPAGKTLYTFPNGNKISDGIFYPEEFTKEPSDFLLKELAEISKWPRFLTIRRQTHPSFLHHW